jgi:ribosomal protein S18 acetylase RimI-like enzyme
VWRDTAAKRFYDLKLGERLFNFNVQLAKTNGQAGIWLYTWKDNHRAINFYKKNGFIINGSYSFTFTEELSNPNHRMFLKL